MRCVQELEPAILHERDVASHELELQRCAVARRSKQHGLRLERHALLAACEHVLGDVTRLVRLVLHGDELRSLADAAHAREILGESLRGVRHHGVGRVEDRLRRAVVDVERHRGRRRIEQRRKVEDVAHFRCAESVDGLRVVADDGDAFASGLHAREDGPLQAIRILVFVDEHVIEERRHLARKRLVGEHGVPVQEEVVEVQDVLCLLRVDVCGEEPGERVFPLHPARKSLAQNTGQRLLRIDDARVDRHAGAGGREPALLDVDRQRAPRDAHQVLGIAAVVDGELGCEGDALGVKAQQLGAGAVERARPRQHDRDVAVAAAQERSHDAARTASRAPPPRAG